jgi:hypothetical protein
MNYYLNSSMNYYMQFWIKLQLELNDDISFYIWTSVMHMHVRFFKNSRAINLYFNFVVNQGKWLILLKAIFWIILELPCHVVLTQYELDAHDVLVDILFENLFVTQS